jgi:outer membrane lipopolysaccharide assembly protein LptE/RlpB
MKKRALLLLAAAAVLMPAGCGYNLVGRGGQFPAGIEKVAVPIFANETKNPEIARRLTNAFVRELNASGKVKVVDLVEADGVVNGTVTRIEVEGITFNAERQATENRMVVATDVVLLLKGQEEPVFEQRDVTRYYEYPIPEDLAVEQKEEDLAYREISRELSQRIISLMTEGF